MTRRTSAEIAANIVRLRERGTPVDEDESMRCDIKTARRAVERAMQRDCSKRRLLHNIVRLRVELQRAEDLVAMAVDGDDD